MATITKPQASEREFMRDGNAFALLDVVQRAYHSEDLAAEWIAIRAEATSGDYDHLLQSLSTAVELVSDDEDDEDEDDDRPTCCECGDVLDNVWDDRCDVCQEAMDAEDNWDE